MARRKRRTSDGSLVAQFGDGGFITSDPSRVYEGPKNYSHRTLNICTLEGTNPYF